MPVCPVIGRTASYFRINKQRLTFKFFQYWLSQKTQNWIWIWIWNLRETFLGSSRRPVLLGSTLACDSQAIFTSESSDTVTPPDSYCTRAHAAIFIHKWFKKIKWLKPHKGQLVGWWDVGRKHQSDPEFYCPDDWQLVPCVFTGGVTFSV